MTSVPTSKGTYWYWVFGRWLMADVDVVHGELKFRVLGVITMPPWHSVEGTVGDYWGPTVETPEPLE